MLGKKIRVWIVGLSGQLGSYEVLDTESGFDLLKRIVKDYPAQPVSVVSLVIGEETLDLYKSLKEQGVISESLVTYVIGTVSQAERNELLKSSSQCDRMMIADSVQPMLVARLSYGNNLKDYHSTILPCKLPIDTLPFSSRRH